MKHIDDGEAVRREGTDAARGLITPLSDVTAVSLLAKRERRAPHVSEFFVDDEFRRVWSVRIDSHFVGITFDPIWRRPALNTFEVEVGLVIDAPQLVGDQ